MGIAEDRTGEPPTIIIGKGESLAGYRPESNLIRLGGDLRSPALPSQYEKLVEHYLIHEIHHWILHKLEDYRTSKMYNNVCEEVEGPLKMNTKIRPDIQNALDYLSGKQ